MGDRSSCTFTVYTCPDQHTANVILGIADQYGFGHEWAEPASLGGSRGNETLTLSEPFTCHELSLGYDDLIAKELQELGVIAHVQQDAKYEYDGSVYMTHPTMGLYTSTGSNGGDGDVLVRAIDIENLVAHATDRMELCRSLLKLTGKAWRDDIDAAMVDITSGRFPTTWTYDLDHDCEKCHG